MNLVFVGFKHRHTGEIYNEAMANPDIRVLGAWEDTEEGKKLADGLGMDFNYATFEDVLNDDSVDAICLGGCYGERGQEAIAALKAGKHVYGDKPICTSLEELDEIEKLSKEKGLKVNCYFTMRFSKGMKTLKDLIDNGELGEIGCINMTAQHPLQYGTRPMWYFEEGKHGGTINDIAIHGVDLIRFLTGLGLKNVVAARTWNHFASEEKAFEDCGQFMVELDNGAGFIGDVSYAAPASCGFQLETYWRITIWGTKGVAEYKVRGSKVEKDGVTTIVPLLQVALEGSKEGFVPYDGEGFNTTGLEEFLKDIKGEDTINSTESVLKTCRDVLTIQAAADR